MRRTQIVSASILGAAAAIVLVGSLALTDDPFWGQAAPVGEMASANPDATLITCDIDLDDHPTRTQVIEVLGEPVDVEHDAGQDDPIDGSEWIPATDTLTWADGDQVSFDSDTDRASSWVMDDPRVC